MQNEFVEEMTKAYETSYAAFYNLSAINTEAVKELTELQLGLAKYNVESGIELTRMIGDAASCAEILNAETEFVNEYGVKMMEFSRKTVDVLSASRNEIVAWLNKTVNTAPKGAKPVSNSKRKKLSKI